MGDGGAGHRPSFPAGDFGDYWDGLINLPLPASRLVLSRRKMTGKHDRGSRSAPQQGSGQVRDPRLPRLPPPCIPPPSTYAPFRGSYKDASPFPAPLPLPSENISKPREKGTPRRPSPSRPISGRCEKNKPPPPMPRASANSRRAGRPVVTVAGPSESVRIALTGGHHTLEPLRHHAISTLHVRCTV